MTVVVNTTVFRNIMPYSVIRKYQRFGETCCIIFRVELFFILNMKVKELSNPKNRDITFWRNVDAIYQSTHHCI